MNRLLNTNVGLVPTLKKGLAKYAKAMVTQGNARKKPSQSYVKAVDAVNLHRGEQERQGILIFNANTISVCMGVNDEFYFLLTSV